MTILYIDQYIRVEQRSIIQDCGTTRFRFVHSVREIGLRTRPAQISYKFMSHLQNAGTKIKT
jgi:hypothetical protein